MLNSKFSKVIVTAALVAAPIATMGVTTAHADDFSQPGVYLCKDANYMGGCHFFSGSGLTTPSDVVQYPRTDIFGENDSYSSIKIVGPYKVTLFNNAMYDTSAGWQEFFFDDPNLADDGIGNDTVSSFKMVYSPNTSEGVFMSTDAGYTGATVMYTSSASTIAWDKMYSSLKIHGRYKVTLYSGQNYTGSSVTFDPSIGQLTDIYTLASYGFNDTASSIKVEKY